MSFTRLMEAATRGNLEGVRANLGDLKKVDENGNTALIMAAYNGHKDCIFLLKKELGMQNSYSWTALMYAACYGKEKCVRLLLSEAGKSTMEGSGILISDELEVSFPAGITALMIAVHQNHPEIVELLLPYEQGMTDSNGHTAKWYAHNSSWEGDFTRVRELLENEGTERKPPPSPDLLDQKYVNDPSVEMESIERQHTLFNSAPDETRNGLSFLKDQLEKFREMYETSNKRVCEAEKSLTDAREEVSSLKQQLNNAIDESKRHAEMCEDLRRASDQNRALINALTTEKATLQEQLSKAIEDLKKELADQKARILALEEENARLRGESLITAVNGEDLKAIRKRLDQAGQKDSSGMTALMHAASRGQTEVVRLLRPLEARLQDGRGWTALMHAVGGGHEECVGLLLLERDLKDGEGRTAAEHAVDEKMRKVLVHQPSFPRLPDSLSGYHLTAVLGRGAFGDVYAGHGNSRNVAVKVVSLGGHDDEERELLRREAEIFPSLDHPNVIRCLGTGKDNFEDTFVLVMDLCCGDLCEEMNRRKKANSSYSDQEIWKTIREVADALTYLHEKKLVHRDLKPENIFFGQDGRCVLGDFGVAKVLEDSSWMATHAGTQSYMAPEIYRGEGYNKSVDIWAMGVVAYEMCTGDRPFESVAAILEKTPAPHLEGRPSDLATLISRMLSRDPKDRPAARDVLEEAMRHQ
ncbi:Kinase, NEK [Giardia muris]|uniref:non-specific serine/threonine protein kinase n=1 Tax=Giardia muris TaxID=5742 RepID=A0A4Z1T967_GIAMU|nr:Kinase, NEK [Giardia muris]|eukprot:TNJ30683.1 Kinase, NEK [Giardia muris]